MTAFYRGYLFIHSKPSMIKHCATFSRAADHLPVRTSRAVHKRMRLRGLSNVVSGKRALRFSHVIHSLVSHWILGME